MVKKSVSHFDWLIGILKSEMKFKVVNPIKIRMLDNVSYYMITANFKADRTAYSFEWEHSGFHPQCAMIHFKVCKAGRNWEFRGDLSALFLDLKARRICPGLSLPVQL